MKRYWTVSSLLRSLGDRPRSTVKSAARFHSSKGISLVGIWTLVPNERIVQAWRVVTWPEGAYSIVKFELKPQGSGTHVVFDHIGFPEGLHDHLAAGWEENYWSLLKKYFH